MSLPVKEWEEDENMKVKEWFPGMVLFLLFLLCSILAAFFFWRENEVPKEPVLLGMVDITVDKGDKLPDLKENLTMNEAVETVVIDTSEVDLNEPGEYPIRYRYTDLSGQIYEKTVWCTVEEKDPGEEERQETPEPGGTGIVVFRANVPKTRDTSHLLFYTLLLQLSLAGCGASVYRIIRSKKEGR